MNTNVISRDLSTSTSFLSINAQADTLSGDIAGNADGVGKIPVNRKKLS